MIIHVVLDWHSNGRFHTVNVARFKLHTFGDDVDLTTNWLVTVTMFINWLKHYHTGIASCNG